MTLQLLKYQRAMCSLYFDWRPYSFPIYISKYKFQPNVISDLNLPHQDFISYRWSCYALPQQVKHVMNHTNTTIRIMAILKI